MSTRLLFLCPALIPGRNGVGDYTRRLAAECRRQGAEARILSLCDSGSPLPLMEEEQMDGETAVTCLRLPGEWTWKQRLVEARKWLEVWRPDWVSLQFVPFGYQSKGVPYRLGSFLSRFPRSPRWHIMFHELWVGAYVGAPWKLRLLGAIQKQVIRQLLGTLKPELIHTQASPHLHLLKRFGRNASLLPLFGNIPIRPNGGMEGRRLIASGLKGASPGHCEQSGWHVGCLFGVIHPEWKPEPFFGQWLKAAEKGGKRPVLVLVGRNGRSREHLEGLWRPYHSDLAVSQLGPLQEPDVSQVLQAVDFGLASTPWQLREKSGSLAAMREHGLPVVLTRDDWNLRGSSGVPFETEDGLCHLARLDQQVSLESLTRRGVEDKLPGTATAFLNGLGTSRSVSKREQKEVLTPGAPVAIGGQQVPTD